MPTPPVGTTVAAATSRGRFDPQAVRERFPLLTA